MKGQLPVQMMDRYMCKGAVMAVDTAHNLVHHASQLLQKHADRSLMMFKEGHCVNCDKVTELRSSTW